MNDHDAHEKNDRSGGGRYLSLGFEDRRRMLEAVGVDDVDALFATIPPNLRYDDDLPLERRLSEPELVRAVEGLSRRNVAARGVVSFLGAGCYPHWIPAHVDALIQRQEFMTAYTPYQAEVAQGTLQTIFEFQSLICMLTGMEVCNASVYDGGSAVAEAVLMARRIRGRGGRVLWSEALHPAYREIARTYSTHLDVEFELLTVDDSGRTSVPDPDDDVLAVVVQQPNFFGVVEDLAAAGARVGKGEALFIVAGAEPLAWALTPSPGEAGADIVVGELQSFGNPMNYGGPLVGFMACRDRDKRNLPGRLVGETVDEEGRRGYVLTLATREQHIRRGRATSNICTNEALCALASCIVLCSYGRRGLPELARHNLSKATYARCRLQQVDEVEAVYDGPHFNEFVVRLPVDADEVVARCVDEDLVPGLSLGRFDPERRDQLLVCATEIHGRDEIDRMVDAVGEACS